MSQLVGTDATTRREFMKRFSASAAVLGMNPAAWLDRAPVRIARIEVFPVVYPMVGRFKFFEGPEGSPTGRSAAIVKVTAEDGTVGWGESVPIPKWSYETRESVTTTIRNYLAPELIGHDVFDIVGAHAVMDRNVAASFGTGAPMAKAGIDLALHDLAGKLTRQSIPERWGRAAAQRLTLSWTLNPVSLDQVDELLEEGWGRGYRNFNIKVGPDLKFDLELARRVRARAPDGFLWADANGGYDVATALEAAPKLADIGVDVLEQPVPLHRLSAYRELKRQGALPILVDEGVVSPDIIIELIQLDMIDGVAMKPARCGGLEPARRQIETVLDAGLMWLGSGLTDPDLSLAGTLATYGAFGYRLPAALNGPQFVAGSVLRTPLRPNPDGTIDVPTGPGLGIEVDEEKVRGIVRE